MPADFTDLLENVSAPPMHVDAETVLTRGRRRRLRRRAARFLQPPPDRVRHALPLGWLASRASATI